MQMYNLQGALLLSTGNKAKTRTSEGLILIVAVFYLPLECYWYVGWVDEDGDGTWYGYGGAYSRVQEYARSHGVSPDAHVWLPVEMPFADKAKEQEHGK